MIMEDIENGYMERKNSHGSRTRPQYSSVCEKEHSKYVNSFGISGFMIAAFGNGFMQLRRVPACNVAWTRLNSRDPPVY